jgi:hypothetical protein
VNYLRSATAAAVEIDEPPAWAELTSFDALHVTAPEVFLGSRYHFVGGQTRVGDGSTAFLTRNITEVVASEGLQNSASVEVVFHPDYERFIAHFVRVYRGGTLRDVDCRGFELFRRERDMERAMFDGRMTAHLVIPDLRVGDVVEVCHSIVGQHPVFGDRFTAGSDNQWNAPVGLVERRLLAPVNRDIAWDCKGLEPAYSQQDLDGWREHRWTWRDQPAFRYEAAAAPGWIGHSSLLTTDRLSWAEVADIFRAGYGVAQLPEELASECRRIANDSPDPAERAVMALRFVQNELRYLAIGLGEGGLAPRPVDAIWETRFGDCKDTSRLLVAMLRDLGLDAHPALVSTFGGPYLMDAPPRLTAFNHCIVRLRLDGRSYWLDPTSKSQGGRLEKLVQPRFGWALPLEADAAPVEMGRDDPQVLCDIEHQIDHPSTTKEPSRLVVKCTLRGWRADQLRHRVVNEGKEAVAKSFRDYYADRFGPLESMEPFLLTDRFDENEIETVESYRMLNAWRLSEDGKYLGFTTPDETIGPTLPGIRSNERHCPIDLGPPRTFVQRTIVTLGQETSEFKFDESWQVGPVRIAAKCRTSSDKRRVTLDTSVTVEDPVMEAKDGCRYFDVYDTALDHAAVTFVYFARGGDFSAPGLTSHGFKSWFAARWGLVVWAVLALSWLLVKLASGLGGGSE